MKILITAGPTWVKIDQVRILTTVFTGRTGLYLAEQFKKHGDDVTLVINPHCLGEISGFRIINFNYFNDFKEKITQDLKKNKYDAIIHSAAVSDYNLKKPFIGKVASGKSGLTIKLTPAEKIIKIMKRLAKKSFLVQFKLEIKQKGLIDKAYKSLKENKSDIVVANALEDLQRSYQAFIIDKDKKVVTIYSKKLLFNRLCEITRRKNI